MKQPKRLTRDQKMVLCHNGFRPSEWMTHFEDEKYLHVIPRDGKIQDVKILQKK